MISNLITQSEMRSRVVQAICAGYIDGSIPWIQNKGTRESFAKASHTAVNGSPEEMVSILIQAHIDSDPSEKPQIQRVLMLIERTMQTYIDAEDSNDGI